MTTANPYAGTDNEDAWAQGYQYGQQNPNDCNPFAPAPWDGDSITIWQEGALAGRQDATPVFQPPAVLPPVLSSTITEATAEAMTDDELMQQIQLLRSHLQDQPVDAGAQQNLTTLESVLSNRQTMAQQADDNAGASPLAPADNSTSTRFLTVFGKVGDHLGPEAADKLKQIDVVDLVAFTALFVLLEDTPIGWVAMVAGAAMIGKEIAEVIDDVSAFITITIDPNGDLDAAAKHLVDALTKIGIDALIIWLTHKGTGAVKGAINTYVKPAPGFVDMLLSDGTVVRVPAERIPDNAMMSEGSGEVEDTGLPDLVVTEEMIRNAVIDAPLKSQQAGGVSMPRVQRYVDMLRRGEQPPPIKVDDGIIVEGNHRYVAGRIFGRDPPIQPWSGGDPSRVVPWSDLKISPEDW